MDLQAWKERFMGEDPDEKKRIAEKANAAMRAAEQTQGPMPEEEGLEEHLSPGGVLEPEDVPLLFAGAPLKVIQSVGGLASRKLGKKAIDSLKEKGMPERPRFDQAVQAGEAKTGASEFSKFIRKQTDAPESNPAPEKLKSLKQDRFTTDQNVSRLQTEREALDLKSPEGRKRLSEIDKLLKNRTYFEE